MDADGYRTAVVLPPVMDIIRLRTSLHIIRVHREYIYAYNLLQNILQYSNRLRINAVQTIEIKNKICPNEKLYFYECTSYTSDRICSI